MMPEVSFPTIVSIVPHQGRMCLLDRVECWTATEIACRAVSHLDPGNPLRRDDRLAGLCGIEYALQAAAAHGGLLADAPEPAGYLASLRRVDVFVDRLDDPALGELRVSAMLLLRDLAGCIYRLGVASASGVVLVTGQAVISLPGKLA